MCQYSIRFLCQIIIRCLGILYFIPLSLDGRLSCLCFLSVVLDAAMNVVHRLLHRCLHFSWCMAASGVAGSQSGGVLSSLRNVQTASDWLPHFPFWQCCAVSVSPWPRVWGLVCLYVVVQVVSVPLGESRHEPEDRRFQGEQLSFSVGPAAEGAVQPGSETGAAVPQHRCPWPRVFRFPRQ